MKLSCNHASKRNFSNRFLRSSNWPSGFPKIILVNPEFGVKDINVDDPTDMKRDENGALSGCSLPLDTPRGLVVTQMAGPHL